MAEVKKTAKKTTETKKTPAKKSAPAKKKQPQKRIRHLQQRQNRLPRRRVSH